MFIYRSRDHRDLHSFPTRRSSDLSADAHRQSVLQPRAVEHERHARKGGSRGGAEAGVASRHDFLESEIVRAREDAVRSEEHTSELSHANISYAVFCLKKKKKTRYT